MNTPLSKHPARDELEKLWRSGLRGAELAKWLRSQGHPPAKRKTLNEYGRRHWNGEQHSDANNVTEVEIDGSSDVDQQLAAARELMEKANAAGVGRVKQLKVESGGSEWDGWTREPGEEQATPAQQRSERRKATIVLTPETKDGSAFEVRQAEPVNVQVEAAPKRVRRNTGYKFAVVLPDRQIPFEDPAALDVAHQVVARVQEEHGIDAIVNLGDDLDLPEFGSHRTAPAALGMLSEAVQRAHAEYAKLRALAPDARIVWIEGNHEVRLQNWLTDHAPHLIALERPGEETHPVLSVPFLCRLDELGVEYVAPYPEGEVWLNDNLRFIHGDTAKSGKGANAAGYLQKESASTVYGHIHRAELLYQTRHTRYGPRTFLAGSPGTLCRLDGKVPSAHTGVNSRGATGQHRTEDWQQGLWVMAYQEDGDQLYNVEPVQIWGGRALFRGELLEASVDADGMPL